MVLIFLAFGSGFQLAATVANRFGTVAVLPLLPVFYMVAGFAMASITVLLKSFLLPRSKVDEPIKLFSAEFFKWWLVSRAIDLTNILFMKHFRGTVILNYYYSLLVSKRPSYGGDIAGIHQFDPKLRDCLTHAAESLAKAIFACCSLICTQFPCCTIMCISMCTSFF